MNSTATKKLDEIFERDSINLKHRPILKMREVIKAYTTSEDPFIALSGIDLDVTTGEFLGITGKSGAGKTTLLNMIAGISAISSGEVIFYGHKSGKNNEAIKEFPIHAMDEDILAIWRGANLGIVYQSFELIPTLNLVENVMLPQDFSGAYHPKISKERALELLELVGIVDHAYKIPAHISGGQKQRVAIARALVNDPPLIIADEPTGNLDSVTAENIFQIFETLVARGKTIIMVTHDDSLAERFSRRVIISDGLFVESSVINPASSGQKISSKKETTDELLHPSAGQPEMRTVDIESITANNNRTRNKVRSDHAKNHPAIVLRNVVKIYENAAGQFPALKGIDLQLDYGQFISIVGKSGCGKSTLLNMITGIDYPTSGKVIVGNEDIYSMTESQRALWRGKNLGVVFQFFQLLPTLTLLENTMLPMDYCKIHAFHERPKRALELLELVGLGDQAYKLPGSVSSGQQQSAAIARALATDPPIVLADEPTGNLDSRSAAVILRLFEQLTTRGKTIMIVTHDPTITQRTDQTVILSDGEIVEQTEVA